METKRKTAVISLSNQWDGKIKKKRIICEPVIIKGFEKWDFVVHKAVGSKNRYNVTHVQTGRAITNAIFESYSSKQAAISAATKLLKRKGKRKLQAQIDKYLIEVQ